MVNVYLLIPALTPIVACACCVKECSWQRRKKGTSGLMLIFILCMKTTLNTKNPGASLPRTGVLLGQYWQ